LDICPRFPLPRRARRDSCIVDKFVDGRLLSGTFFDDLIGLDVVLLGLVGRFVGAG